MTEGLAEDFSELDQQLHQGLIKPKVLYCLGNMPWYCAVDLELTVQHVGRRASYQHLHGCLTSILVILLPELNPGVVNTCSPN